jgi:hypothetical protein
MIGLIVPLILRAGVPQRFARLAAWIVAAVVLAALCGAAVAMFREWVSAGKEEAVRIDQQDVTIEAANLVINATSAATANQMERDDAFQNEQEELRHEADTKSDASSAGPGVQSVLDRMREQQAAGRRGARPSR